MPRCPACGRGRIAMDLTPDPRAMCLDCGTRWVQDGAEQRRVRVVSPPSPHVVSHSRT